MPLAPGVRLGAYEIVSLIGSGGMGEVYRAHDPRLGRDVAVKILPAAFSGDAERLQRFEQEARAAAALNHPNITAVYDIGTHEHFPYIVSELLEGQSLRERLRAAPHGTDPGSAGPVPVRKAIDYAAQVANGLAAAHEKGIVHRDLKPENLFITADGRAKILDFGLAKLTQAEPAAAGIGLSVTSPDTRPGLIMGTFGYMSPEQVRGAPVDHRSDIFAFGTILYELLSGRRAFRGDTIADTMTAILKDDPDDLPVTERHVPPGLERIVDRCLEKSPAARFQSTKDLAFALESLSAHSGPADALAAASGSSKARMQLPWTIAAVSGVAGTLAIALAATMFVRRAAVDERATRFFVHPPDGWVMSDRGSTVISSAPVAISPDGSWIAFIVTKRDERDRVLHLRARDSLASVPLPGTEGISNPFWSPDNRSIGFFADGKLKKIDIAGGPPIVLCDAAQPVGGTWSPSGVILFAPTTRTVLQKVSSAGGVPAAATAFGPGEISHSRPTFLPDGRHFLYRVLTEADSSIYVGTLDSPDRTRVLVTSSANVRYAQGHLLFVRDRTLMAQPFDARALKTTGGPVPIAQQIRATGAQGYGVFAVSANGVLAYQEGAPSAGVNLTWFDRSGKSLGAVGDASVYGDLRLSPDGLQAAVSAYDPDPNTRDIWIVDLVRGVRTRFTTEPSDDTTPVWSPDGSRIAFSSRRKSVLNLYVKPVRRAGGETAILETAAGKSMGDWSPDGRFILFHGGTTGGATTNDVWLLPLGGGAKPSLFESTTFNETTADFSPDGQWIAFVSDETGRQEVYVAPFPGPGGKVLISTGGGVQPRWRGDGREIFYLDPERRLMAAAVSGDGSTFAVGDVRPLFEMNAGVGIGSVFDVTADGQRVLAIIAAQETRLRPEPLTVVINWTAGLKR